MGKAPPGVSCRRPGTALPSAAEWQFCSIAKFAFFLTSGEVDECIDGVVAEEAMTLSG